MTNLINHHFVYKNCYGSLSKYWPLYIKIIDITENNYYKIIQFQATSENMFEVKISHLLPHSLFGYDEISEEEYKIAWNKFINQINEIHIKQ